MGIKNREGYGPTGPGAGISTKSRGHPPNQFPQRSPQLDIMKENLEILKIRMQKRENK
jgi:hypothetical protein